MENTKAATARLDEAGYMLCDKCLHCTYTQALDRDGGWEWVLVDWSEDELHCRRHNAWVKKTGICKHFTMDGGVVCKG